MISRTTVTPMSTFHEFEMTSITGDQVSFDRFAGQFCLVVNVASR
jgi:glutathione peroxidase-family protein